jgi:thiamine-monophosphate kinase
MNEFDFIETYLAPLSGAGARGLQDDVALIKGRENGDYILSVDSFVEGLHFPKDWPPAKIGPRILRAAMSDIVAKGAVPSGYTMSLAVPPGLGEAFYADFSLGLKSAQTDLRTVLLGGDTVSTTGPLLITFSVFGQLQGAGLPRSNARAGDDVWVTGTIGDAGLGLKHMHGDCAPNWQLAYERPTLWLALSEFLPELAHASADVSDGLIADAGHIAKTSGVGITLRLAEIPVSAPTRAWLKDQPSEDNSLIFLATAGDDYQAVFTAPPHNAAILQEKSQSFGVPLTKIGMCERGQGVKCLNGDGEKVTISRAGYTHF